MADEVILLGLNISMYAMRVKVALAEKVINYEYKEQNLMDKSPLLLQMNPIHKKVPVLIHNGKPICESLIIVQYIDEVWNHTSPPLLPSDPYEKSQARFWADYIDKKLYGEAGVKLWTTEGEVDEATKEDFLGVLKVLEDNLGDKPYFGGENFGFLDIALISYYTWFYTYESFGKLSIESRVPKLIGWAKRCMEKDTVSKSLVDEKVVYDFVVNWRRNKFGVE